MALYDPVDGVYRKVNKSYDPVEGTHRKVIKAYDDVEGVYRQYFGDNLNAGGLAVGDSVWIKVNNIDHEFLVVHQGNPNSAKYDASCDGTWLLMKDIYTKMKWSSTNNNYKISEILGYGGIFLTYLDSVVQSAIKQVKIPYWDGPGALGYVASGDKGLSTKIFQLSLYEVGLTTGVIASIPAEGSVLDYFDTGVAENVNSKRIANFEGKADNWWLRSPYAHIDYNQQISDFHYQYAWYVSQSSVCSTTNALDYSFGFRPAFIIDRDTPIDQSTGKNIIE